MAQEAGAHAAGTQAAAALELEGASFKPTEPTTQPTKRVVPLKPTEPILRSLGALPSCSLTVACSTRLGTLVCEGTRRPPEPVTLALKPQP